jgi:hypothetical protein
MELIDETAFEGIVQSAWRALPGEVLAALVARGTICQVEEGAAGEAGPGYHVSYVVEAPRITFERRPICEASADQTAVEQAVERALFDATGVILGRRPWAGADYPTIF